jgi:hypothetical protein
MLGSPPLSLEIETTKLEQKSKLHLEHMYIYLYFIPTSPISILVFVYMPTTPIPLPVPVPQHSIDQFWLTYCSRDDCALPFSRGPPSGSDPCPCLESFRFLAFGASVSHRALARRKLLSKFPFLSRHDTTPYDTTQTTTSFSSPQQHLRS